VPTCNSLATLKILVVFLFFVAESLAPASPGRGQHPSARPPVGGAFPKEIDPSTPHSGLPGISANLVDRPDKLNWRKYGSTV